MGDKFLAEDEYKKIERDGRVIVLSAALDSQCFFLSPDCNKCTHAVYESGQKKCMYDLKTEKCYVCDSVLEFDIAESLGRPEYWQVNETTLTIYYNKFFRGKFGRSIFIDKEKALEMAGKFNSPDNDEAVIEDFTDVLTYDDFIKLYMQNRILILPCKIGEKYYVAEPDCTECKYKNDGYKGCGYIPKEGESPYTCNYDSEFGRCYVFNQHNGNTFYISHENYCIEEVHLMSESQYDLDRKSFYGVWTDRNKLKEILKTVKK